MGWLAAFLRPLLGLPKQVIQEKDVSRELACRLLEQGAENHRLKQQLQATRAELKRTRRFLDFSRQQNIQLLRRLLEADSGRRSQRSSSQVAVCRRVQPKRKCKRTTLKSKRGVVG